MITQAQVSCLTIIQIVFGIFFWIIIGLGVYYHRYINSEDCSFQLKDLSDSVNILGILGNIIFTFSTLKVIFIIVDDREDSTSDYTSIFNETIRCNVFGFLFFICAGTVSAVILFQSNILFGDIKCTTEYAKTIIIVDMIGYLWIGIISYIVTSYFLIKKIFFTICDLFKKARVVDFFRRNNAIIESTNCKNTQTDSFVTIPINTYKSDVKSLLCIICMDNKVDCLIKPCYHVCICKNCYDNFSKKSCPVCTLDIKKVKMIYLSGLEDDPNFSTNT